MRNCAAPRFVLAAVLNITACRQDAPVLVALDAERDAGVDGGVVTQPSCPDGPSAETGCGTVWVEGGTFDMGEPDDPFAGCLAYQGCPVQSGMSVSGFYIDTYEVTVSRFQRFLDAHEAVVSPVRYPNGEDVVITFDPEAPGVISDASIAAICNLGVSGRERHPINCVDWNTALAFCVWDGGRLPTEAEWEFGARGTEGRIYPWGDAPEPTCGGFLGCNLAQCGSCTGEDGGKTRRVGSFPGGATPLGLKDMAGNVREWTADMFELYGARDCWPGTAQTDPLCMSTSSGRALRGEPWSGTAGLLRSAVRYPGVDDTRDDTGFRCARSVP